MTNTIRIVRAGSCVELETATVQWFYDFLKDTPEFFDDGELPATDDGYFHNALALADGEKWASENGIEFEWDSEYVAATRETMWACYAHRGSELMGASPLLCRHDEIDLECSDFGRAIEALVAFRVMVNEENRRPTPARHPQTQRSHGFAALAA